MPDKNPAKPGRPRKTEWRVKVNVTVGDNQEAVARALETWAILIADHAVRVVVDELRQEAAKRYDEARRQSQHPSDSGGSELAAGE